MVSIQKAGGLLVLMIAAIFLLSTPASVYAEEVEKKAEKSDGKQILGVENVLPKEKLSQQYKRIIIRDMSFEGAAIQQVDETKHPDFKNVVKQLGTAVPDNIAAQLKTWGIFEKVVREGEDVSGDEKTIILVARFTKVTTGNRAARFWVGFGAGSSTVGIAGKLIDKDTGKVIADFESNAHSPMSMSNYRTVLPADGAQNAKKIAMFIKKYY